MRRARTTTASGSSTPGAPRRPQPTGATTYSTKLLELSAELVAQKCAKYDIPAVWLTAAQLRAGKRGITGHAQVSEAFKRTDHTDPGKSFPVEAYLARVREHLGDKFVAPEEHHWHSKAPAQTPMLRQGDEGYQVKRLQRLLVQRGFDAGRGDGDLREADGRPRSRQAQARTASTSTASPARHLGSPARGLRQAR